MIKAAIINIPTDSNELQEISINFLGGAIKSLPSFSIDDNLIDSIKSGLIYLYKENDRKKLRAKFEIYFLLQY